MTTSLGPPVLEEMSFARYLPPGPHEVRLEPVAPRVRALLATTTFADTSRAMVMLETGRLPAYYFPLEDVRTDCLEPGSRDYLSPYKGRATYMDIVAGDRRAENAAWAYRAAPPGCPGLGNYVAVHWAQMDAWFEDDTEVFGHARDPHKRLDMVPCAGRLEVLVEGVQLADSRGGLVLAETDLPPRYYLPRADVRLDHLNLSATTSLCPYKGRTSEYWMAPVGGISVDVAWSYAEPLPSVRDIAGLMCFFNERVDIILDGVVQPRPRSPWS